MMGIPGFARSSQRSFQAEQLRMRMHSRRWPAPNFKFVKFGSSTYVPAPVALSDNEPFRDLRQSKHVFVCAREWKDAVPGTELLFCSCTRSAVK